MLVPKPPPPKVVSPLNMFAVLPPANVIRKTHGMNGQNYVADTGKRFGKDMKAYKHDDLGRLEEHFQKVCDQVKCNFKDIFVEYYLKNKHVFIHN